MCMTQHFHLENAASLTCTTVHKKNVSGEVDGNSRSIPILKISQGSLAKNLQPAMSTLNSDHVMLMDEK